jgi:ATP-dependent DNA helicase DinG
MSPLIEVTVHNALRDLLRQQKEIANWPHYLTMARLVARTLRLSRSVLIQTGLPTQRREGKYRLSYLIAALLWDGGVAIVVSSQLHQQLRAIEIPQIQHWLGTNKSIYIHDRAPVAADFCGLWLVSPQAWLTAHLGLAGDVPPPIPTIIEGADDLETWAQELLTITLTPSDWESLRQSQPNPIAQMVSNTKIELTQYLWQRPPNPYNCYVLDSGEGDLISDWLDRVTVDAPLIWQQFQARSRSPEPHLVWANINRQQGSFNLAISPVDILRRLAPIWDRQPLVLVTGSVDISGEIFCQQLGLGEITAVKFSLDRQTELFQLYTPRWIPMPNTKNFQPILVTEINRLLSSLLQQPKFVVILVQDTPLQSQLASILAAEWGTRVQVEKTNLDETNILVTGWEFWELYQDDLPMPQLMIIPTLPIPSLEDPLVGAKVNFYKQTKQDWFRLYLLPTGLKILQRAIAPVRNCQGIVAIFDNRIDRRSYGQQVLAALSPMTRIKSSIL